VQESCTLGSVRAKPNGCATRPSPSLMAIESIISGPKVRIDSGRVARTSRKTIRHKESADTNLQLGYQRIKLKYMSYSSRVVLVTSMSSACSSARGRGASTDGVAAAGGNPLWARRSASWASRSLVSPSLSVIAASCSTIWASLACPCTVLGLGLADLLDAGAFLARILAPLGLVAFFMKLLRTR